MYSRLTEIPLEEFKLPLLVSGVVILTSGLFASFAYRKYIKATNFKWEEAGEICQLFIHPVKSAQGIEVKRAFASEIGLSSGNLLDRSFVIIDEGTFVSGRNVPLVLSISTKIQNQMLTLTSKDGEQFIVDMNYVVDDNRTVKFKLRCTMVQGLDCGDEVGKWLANVLKMEDKDFRLIFRGFDNWLRPSRKFSAKFNEMKHNDVASYQDAATYMVMSQSSIDDLNTRLEKPVDATYFRPSILITGKTPYDEDNWSHIKVGENVIIRIFKPCERCLMVQRVPITGEERTDHFNVLKSYRLVSWPPDVAKVMAHRPIMGVQCGIDVVGEIAVGDKVFVYRQKKPFWLIN